MTPADTTHTNAPAASTSPWTPDSWRSKLAAQQVRYPDRAAVDRAAAKLASLPPLVTSHEIERLKSEMADAAQGKRFVLQGGDCAESLDQCRPEAIASKLKILLQMSLVLVHGIGRPVTRIGRFAGQYAKPRSSETEKGVYEGPEGKSELELPSYFGDLVNRPEFTPDARTPDPHLMVRGYQHAAMTLNFIRSLMDGRFADFHHPENWNLRFVSRAKMSDERRAQYEKLTETLAAGLTLMESLGEQAVHEIARVEFFTSHEGLNLIYESSQTRQVPGGGSSWYDLTTHLPWIGERTRQPDGAHVEFFRGISNPVGVKCGPTSDPDEIAALVRYMNPSREPGKIMLIPRMGAKKVETNLQPLLEGIAKSGEPVLWSADPMHGNGITTQAGIKTRNFDDIQHELEVTADAHRKVGTNLGGVHFELTGDDVTECVGGASGISEQDLATNYESFCDPRLNYEQAMELAFILASKLSQ